MSNPPSYSQILLKRNVESQTQPPGVVPEPADIPSQPISTTSSDGQSGRTTPLNMDPRPSHSKSEISALEESVKALNLAAIETPADPALPTNGPANDELPAMPTIAQRPGTQILGSQKAGDSASEKSASVSILTPGSQFSESVPFANQLPDLPVTRIDAPSDEPDERLLTALENPRDRYFILKFEQEAYTFVQKKTSLELQVPPMNSYHRLLVHQLAEYYRLTHVSDEKGSITLRVSEHTRIPATRLQDIAEAKGTGQDTPPAGVAVKMIMRRTPSKGGAGGNDSGSEKGGAGADQKQADSKTSREEREAAYQAARQRIFGDFKESSDAQPAKKSEKTTPKKHIQDDDFSDRNQFVPLTQTQPHYYPPSHYQTPMSSTFTPSPWPTTAQPSVQATSSRPNAAAPVWSPGVTGYAPTGPPRGSDFPSAQNSQYQQHSYNTSNQHQHQQHQHPQPQHHQPLPQHQQQQHPQHHQPTPTYAGGPPQRHFNNTFIPPQAQFPDKSRFNHSFPSSAVSTPPPPMGGIVRPPTVPPSVPQPMSMGGYGMGNPNQLHMNNTAMQRGHSMNSSFKPQPVGPPSGQTYGGGYPNLNTGIHTGNNYPTNNAGNNFSHPNGMQNHGMTSPTMYNNNLVHTSVHSQPPQNGWSNSAWQQPLTPLSNTGGMQNLNHGNIGNGTFNNQRKDLSPQGPWMNGQPNQYGGMGRQ